MQVLKISGAPPFPHPCIARNCKQDEAMHRKFCCFIKRFFYNMIQFIFVIMQVIIKSKSETVKQQLRRQSLDAL